MDCANCRHPILAIEARVDPRTAGHLFVAQCGHEQSATAARDLWLQGLRWDVPAVTGTSMVSAERHRQVYEEGHTAEADATLEPNDLTWASWCLLDAAASDVPVTETPRMWPDAVGEWKPEHDPMRRLVIAGALIAAEIDRRLAEGRAHIGGNR